MVHEFREGGRRVYGYRRRKSINGGRGLAPAGAPEEGEGKFTPLLGEGDPSIGRNAEKREKGSCVVKKNIPVGG